MIMPRRAHGPICSVLGAVAILAGFTGPAHARTSEISQLLFDENGWPVLLAQGLTDYEDPVQAAMSWRICSPVCGEEVGTNMTLEAGPTAAGTRFQVTSSLGTKREVLLSKPWLGQVQNVTPPAIQGTPAIGATIMASPGTWSGGWGGEGSLLGLVACRTPAALDCRGIEESVFHDDVKARPFKIPTAYGGWYVGARESRYAADTAWAGTGLEFPGNQVSPHTVRRPDRTEAVSPLLGPIPEPTAAQRAAAKPVVRLRATAQRRNGRYLLGTLTCPEGCDGGLLYTQGRREGGGELSASAGKPLPLLADAEDVRPGRRLKVRVTVEGLGRFIRIVRIPGGR